MAFLNEGIQKFLPAPCVEVMDEVTEQADVHEGWNVSANHEKARVPGGSRASSSQATVQTTGGSVTESANHRDRPLILPSDIQQ